MRWELWEPWYERIAKRLGLDKRSDENAAKVLNGLLPEPNIQALRGMIHGHECIVFGAGPSLKEDIEKIERAGYLNKILIAADGATSAVMSHRNPDVIGTDLDGAVDDQLKAWRMGSRLIVHAHGDNIKQVRKITPKLNERVIGTTQVKPFGKLFNFGGFTDGDRAAFMAHEFGASKIYLAGMDLGSKIGKYSGRKNIERKLMKFEICKELLMWLVKELGAPIFNITSGGEKISGVPKMSIPR